MLAERRQVADFQELALLSQAVEYRVLQRTLVKKLGADPGAPVQTVKLTRRVGAVVFTTGRTWRGPRGGEWVELDSITEKPGWLLVEGPGFGIPGPLLRRVEDRDEPVLVLSAARPVVIRDPSSVELGSFVAGPSSSVRDAKEWIALLFGLEPSLIIISQPDQSWRDGCAMQYYGKPLQITQGSQLLADDDRLGDAGFRDGDEVGYVYTGRLDKTRSGEDPGWIGKMAGGSAKTGKPAPEVAPADLELQRLFQVLGLEEGTPGDAVKRHYRRLALECHPDKQPDDVEAATRRFQDIRAAYEALRDRLQF